MMQINYEFKMKIEFIRAIIRFHLMWFDNYLKKNQSFILNKLLNTNNLSNTIMFGQTKLSIYFFGNINI